MSTSQRYFLDGGIDNGNNVFLYFSLSGVPYLLVSQIRTNGITYLASSKTIGPSGQTSNTYIPTFTIDVKTYSTISSDPVTYKLRDTTSSYLGIDDNGYLINTKDASIFSSAQNTYQPWREPTVFLAGAQYSFSVGVIPVLLPILEVGTLDTSKCELYFVPTVWYQQGFCAKAGKSIDGLTYTYCYITNNTQDGYCTNIPYAWTKQTECNISLPYNYCSSGIYCSKDCMAPCSKSTDVCQWNYKQQAFQCNFAINEVFSGPWWQSIWVIVILLIICGICILFIILLPIFKNKDPKEGDTFFIKGVGEEKVVS